MKGTKLLRRIFYLSVIQLFIHVGLQAQEPVKILNDIYSELQKSDSTDGNIILYQDAALNVLVDKNKRINKNKLKGFRIQIYRGSGQEARNQSNMASQKLMEKLPDLDPTQIYVIYETPYFKLRYGDYRTKNEAFEVLYRVKEYFRDAYIVNSKIRYPKLKADNELVNTNNNDE